MNPSSNPFMRSLTSRTQYKKEVANEGSLIRKHNNIDDESLYTEEDHCE